MIGIGRVFRGVYTFCPAQGVRFIVGLADERFCSHLSSWNSTLLLSSHSTPLVIQLFQSACFPYRKDRKQWLGRIERHKCQVSA